MTIQVAISEAGAFAVTIPAGEAGGLGVRAALRPAEAERLAKLLRAALAVHHQQRALAKARAALERANAAPHARPRPDVPPTAILERAQREVANSVVNAGSREAAPS